MNVKVIILITLLTFLILGTVNAADNVTYDNLTDENPIDEINVTFKQQMWQENLSDIEVDLPENSSGDFCIKIDDEVIYNQTITEKSFKVPIKLPKRERELYITIFPGIDCRNYKVDAFYNGEDLNLNKTLKVMKLSPDFNYLNFPEEILKDDYYRMLVFPRSSNGIVEIYLDNKLLNKTQVRPVIYLDKFNLNYGSHTLKIIFYNDTYYSPINRTFDFNVTQAVISIPKTVNIGHDDCISVRTEYNVQGTVNVYLDSKLIDSAKLEDGDYILSLQDYLKVNSHEVTVTLKTKDFTRTKTRPINITYDFDVFAYSLIYGEKNTVEIDLPDNLNNKLLTVLINGTKYSFKRQSNVVNNAVEVDISSLGVGNYSMFISYPGDERFKPHNKTYNFTVTYQIICPYDVEFKDGSKIRLTLPGNAMGNLAVYVDGKIFKTIKIEKGHAEARIDSLSPGRHKINAMYDGGDYIVNPYDFELYVSPKITLTYRFTAGEDKYITVEVPSATKGHVIFDIDGKEHKVSIKNGIAKYSLKNLKAGEHDIYVDYYGSDGVEDLSNWRVVTVYKPKIKIMSGELTFKSINVKVKILNRQNKPIAGKTVVIKINGKKFKVKTNKKGIATLQKSMKLKTKKYKLNVYYMGSTISKKYKAKPVHLKISKTGKKVVIKATINKKLKNRLVIIKVKSKIFKIRTNKNGAAKVIIKKALLKKLKAGKKVTYSATYGKFTQKLTV